MCTTTTLLLPITGKVKDFLRLLIPDQDLEGRQKTGRASQRVPVFVF